MSTEHQQYSPENQLEIIRQYAAAHNMEIVQDYSDHGRSGRQTGQNSKMG
jgi:DNA invertase Pin-like site-specific DNA recombinase